MWEWSIQSAPYNPSVPLADQDLGLMAADLSSDLGPVEIGNERGITDNTAYFLLLFFGGLGPI